MEALKLAFADREAYVGDPAHVDVPVEGLLSEEYAALRRGLIDPNQAQAVYPPGDPQDAGRVTRLPTAADSADAGACRGRRRRYHVPGHSRRAGDMVSATPQQFRWPGPGMILGDTGILINCRGCYFWLDPDNPNVLAPHKRPRTTPCTFIVLKQGIPT